MVWVVVASVRMRPVLTQQECAVVGRLYRLQSPPTSIADVVGLLQQGGVSLMAHDIHLVFGPSYREGSLVPLCRIIQLFSFEKRKLLRRGATDALSDFVQSSDHCSIKEMLQSFGMSVDYLDPTGRPEESTVTTRGDVKTGDHPPEWWHSSDVGPWWDDRKYWGGAVRRSSQQSQVSDALRAYNSSRLRYACDSDAAVDRPVYTRKGSVSGSGDVSLQPSAHSGSPFAGAPGHFVRPIFGPDTEHISADVALERFVATQLQATGARALADGKYRSSGGAACDSSRVINHSGVSRVGSCGAKRCKTPLVNQCKVDSFVSRMQADAQKRDLRNTPPAAMCSKVFSVPILPNGSYINPAPTPLRALERTLPEVRSRQNHPSVVSDRPNFSADTSIYLPLSEKRPMRVVTSAPSRRKAYLPPEGVLALHRRPFEADRFPTVRSSTLSRPVSAHNSADSLLSRWTSGGELRTNV